MFAWVSENLGTIIICLVLFAVVMGVIAVMMRDRKKGKSACGGNCGHCPMSGSCHKH